ncbi:MAG: superinfection immunity protein [Caulobacteraceae bacterium]|nr:superinfection immunity protein [Caulobacter sp.]
MVRLLVSLGFFVAAAIYAAPSVIAVLRARRHWPLVVALNVLLGWTILGWAVALAMALGLRLPRRQKRTRLRARTATAAAPAAEAADAVDAPPAREPAEPPKLHDDSYARWLDGGSALSA